MASIARLPVTTSPVRHYVIAILAGLVAVLTRILLEPLLDPNQVGRQIYIVPLVAVVVVARYTGFGPALATLLTGLFGVVFFLVPPRGSLAVVELPDLLGLVLYSVAGLGCAVLGGAQRAAQHRAERHAAALRISESHLAERARLVALRADVSSHLVSGDPLRTILQRVANILVEHLDVAFARVWTLKEGEQVLELQASAGMYTHTDGPHRRVKVGEFKIGRIASSGRPHLTNDVPNDPNISNPEWARREGMVAFAGYPLLVDGRVVGVLAMFSRSPLSNAVLADLGPLADDLAQCVQRKWAEEALRESEQEYRFLAETVPALVWSSRADGVVDYRNSRWTEYTGLEPEAEETAWADLFHPEDRPQVAERWQRARETGTKYQAEYRLRRADGAYRWFLAQALPMRGTDGRVVRWFGTATDIDDQKRQAGLLERLVAERTAALQQEVDERRRAEELARSTAAELARSNGELEKFAYVASHDLQEPLRKIQAFGDRLRTRFRGELGEQGRDYLDRLLGSAGRMRRLIDDLLSFSRVATKGQPFARVDLAVLAEVVLADLEERIQETGAAVDVGPLPTIEADPTQMRQLLQNLIGNALKFHRPGVPPTVAIRSEVLPPADGPDDRMVCRLTVTDNGIGFDEKYLDRIFQVFQRLHGRQDYEGTGVGLAICRKIVERHGGEITAQSSPGAGSTFIVTLPTRQPSGTHADR
jgi:PAS domain S-box-containing protein